MAVKRWADQLDVKRRDKVKRMNVFSLTEAAIIAWKECRPKTEGRYIGSSIVGTKVCILNQHISIVPVGARGIIWCSKPQLSDVCLG